MLDPLYAAIGWLLSFFYSFIPNLGVSIILLTLTIMLLLFPLTAKQTRSMIAMQRVQPEIKKIQQQYKDDKQKQNEELLKFYQENKINPLAGCLPVLIQMPVLFSLYGTLKKVQDQVPKTGAFNKLYVDLCGSGTSCPTPKGLHFATMNLSISPQNSGSVTSGFVQQLPYFIAVVLVMAAGWYQQYQTLRRQKDQAQNNPMVKQMQMIAKVFPIIFGFFAFVASSGLVLYFLTSSLFRIGQQHFVLSKYYEQANVKPLGPAGEAKEPVSKAERRSAPSRNTSRKKRKRRH